RQPQGRSGERFGHDDVVARNFDRHIGSERGSTTFVIAEMTIKGRERGACADDAEVDGLATRFAKVAFGSIHHLAAEPGSLPRRIDTEQPQVASVIVNLNVDTSGQASGIFSDEKFAFGQVGTNASGVYAITFDEGLLDAKSSVDQTDESLDIGKIRAANAQGIRLSK